MNFNLYQYELCPKRGAIAVHCLSCKLDLQSATTGPAGTLRAKALIETIEAHERLAHPSRTLIMGTRCVRT